MSGTLSVAQVANHLDCSEEKVREALNTGDLPGLKYGRDWIVPADALHQRLIEKSLAEAKQRRESTPSTLEVVMAAAKRKQARVPPSLG